MQVAKNKMKNQAVSFGRFRYVVNKGKKFDKALFFFFYQKVLIFFLFLHENMLWSLIRGASAIPLSPIWSYEKVPGRGFK